MSDDKVLKKWFEISEDELCARMLKQEQCHEIPLKSVVDFIGDAIGKVLKSLGIDISQNDDMIKQQQTDLGITISEHSPEEMGQLSGLYIISGDVPIAIIGDAFLGSDGLAYLDIFWIQKDSMKRFGGVKII